MPCISANSVCLATMSTEGGAGVPAAQNITGKIMLVTGASTGIGRASADRLAAAGAVVVGALWLSLLA